MNRRFLTLQTVRDRVVPMKMLKSSSKSSTTTILLSQQQQAGCLGGALFQVTSGFLLHLLGMHPQAEPLSNHNIFMIISPFLRSPGSSSLFPKKFLALIFLVVWSLYVCVRHRIKQIRACRLYLFHMGWVRLDWFLGK